MAFLFATFLILEELEREDQRRKVRILRRQIRDAQDPFSIPEAEFVGKFRLNKEACRYLLNVLEPHMDLGNYRSRVPVVFRVFAVLSFFASGSYQLRVGNNVLRFCTQSLVSRSIREVSNILVRHLFHKWVCFPKDRQEKNAIKRRFVRRYGMHHVIGVVDGTHVPIVRPADNENNYVNRNGYHSLHCQIICDSHMRILNIVAKCPGRTDEAYMWRFSRIGQTIKANFENGEDENSRIMGDSSYTCLPWFLVPVANPKQPNEQHFNDAFIKCRNVTERCISLFKGRFGCLPIGLHYQPHVATKIILSCAILHNMGIHYRVMDLVPLWDGIDLVYQKNITDEQLGQERRRQYINAYFS